jgi:3-oxoacyl-[acyl-carrier protein] reductase
MLKDALSYLRKSSAPRVIFISSVEGCKGGVQESFSDSIAKGAVRALTLNTAARLAKEGITVNCIAKGAIPRVEPLHDGDVNAADRLPFIPMGRLGTSEDLAGAVCYFASEESSYVTGQILEVGGGI